MGILKMKARYIAKPVHARAAEKEFVYGFAPRRIPAASAALVLVDVWNDLYVADFVARARRITSQKIVPLARAFRAAGSLVIHAPSAEVAKKYPAFLPNLSAAEIRDPATQDVWPPRKFILKTGPYAYRVPPEQRRPTKPFKDIITNWRIAPEMEPQAGDLVIRTGAELHRVLKERRVLWLFYAGYATNVCMLRRTYAMTAMGGRGYEIILVRDATTGMETAQTCSTMRQTRAAITMTEMNIGYSVTSADLLAALSSAKT